MAPAIATWLEANNRYIAELHASGFELTPLHARHGLAALTRNHVTQTPEVAQVVDTRLAASGHVIPLRIFHPDPGQALPVLVYFHGGGHMCGSIEVYDPICRKLALASRHVVVVPEYRLAPEHPWPAGLEDGWQTMEAVFERLQSLDIAHRPTLAIGGDSGGGAMSASLAYRAAAAGLALAAQVLVYPSLDYTMSLPSVSENGVGYLLESSRMQWYFDHYLQSRVLPRSASPLFMPVSAKLPPTLVLTAEFCPLRDEGRAYVKRLTEAGVRSRELAFEQQIHAFLNLEDLCPEDCLRAYSCMGEFLQTSAQADAMETRPS